MFSYISFLKRINTRLRNPSPLYSPEDLADVYTNATFGKLSCGMFHDLINILSVLSLYMDELKSNPSRLSITCDYMDKAIATTCKMHNHITMLRKHLSTNTIAGIFSLNTELDAAAALVNHKARQHNITLSVDHKDTITTYGVALFFYQTVFNLLANAIDACAATDNRQRKITAVIMKKRNYAEVRIMDTGIGIANEQMQKLFTRLHSHKQNGIGMGLSHVQYIVRTYFDGTLSVNSKESRGSVFTVRFPIRKYPQ